MVGFFVALIFLGFAVATGKSDPMQSYFKRRTALAGDIMLAAKMTTIFRMPKRRAG